MFSAMCVCVLVLIDMLIYIHGKGLKAAAFTDEVTLGNARASLSLSSENIRLHSRRRQDLVRLAKRKRRKA
ncbi:hypothetical protein ABFS83_08G031700 [Erythranthe nasuta]